MNLNKLFPRLAIRSKLTIAFAVLAGVPVLVVAAFATAVKVDQLRSTSTDGLSHDLQLARTQVEQRLAEAEQDVAFIARTDLAPALADPTPDRLSRAGQRASALLRYKTAIHQVKLIDVRGDILLLARASGGTLPGREGLASGTYYSYRARALEPGAQLLLPAELRGNRRGAVGRTIPIVAIVMAVRDTAGRFLGTVAGEMYAAALFDALEEGSPHLTGVTGLVDVDGHFLYHSERKREWASLLASRSEVDLEGEFSAADAARMMDGSSGTVETSGRIVSYTPLGVVDHGGGPLFLYRAVDLATLEGPIRRFMRWVGATGVGLGLLVLGIAVLAANQFTRPIYRLQAAMRDLAAGGAPEPLEIQTNDELEDLAEEFMDMATSLFTYRQRLEELVADRTRALHETYEELASILVHSADAIIGVDTDGRVRVWNRGAENLFGYARDEAIGGEVDALIRPAERQGGQETRFLQHRLEREGAVVDFRTERMHKDGRILPVSLSQSVIRNEEGVPRGYSLILRDARTQSRLEQQMRRSERLAAVSVMAASLAHEMNNPLAVITNRIECMQHDVRSTCPDCGLDGDLSVLHHQTTRLADVTRDLLALASDEGGTARVFDPRSCVDRIARLVEPTFSARDVRLVVGRPDHPLPEIRGQEKALETVFLNLLLNAADATPAGGTVWFETRLERERSEVWFEVRDTGPGVPDELRDQIFEPFFTTKGPRGGTGLGLAVCRAVVERHGGRITLADDDGARGGHFVVAIPVDSPVMA